MIPAHLLPHTLTWQRPSAAQDAYGNDTVSWDSPTEKRVRGRLVQENVAPDEETYGRQDVSAGWRLLTNELGIGPADRLVRDGLVYEVVGQPYRVAGIAADHHCEVRLRAVVTG